ETGRHHDTWGPRFIWHQKALYGKCSQPPFWACYQYLFTFCAEVMYNFILGVFQTASISLHIRLASFRVLQKHAPPTDKPPVPNRSFSILLTFLSTGRCPGNEHWYLSCHGTSAKEHLSLWHNKWGNSVHKPCCPFVASLRYWRYSHGCNAPSR